MKSNDASTQPARLAAQLLDQFSDPINRAPRPFRLGLSGLPGSGKSTLAQAMVAAAGKRGWPALALSLDDFYLSRRERLRLARRVHPLLVTRGVPGTHDLHALQCVLRTLRQAPPRLDLRIPRFDKGHDTRRPPSRWRHLRTRPQLLILEGWCLGAVPQGDAALAAPLNTLERGEDSQGTWRRWVNRRLREYLPLWQQLDARIVLQAPDWRSACRWREQAERALRKRNAPRAMDAGALRRFLQHYERIGRHLLEQPPANADWVIDLDDRRRMRIGVG